MKFLDVKNTKFILNWEKIAPIAPDPINMGDIPILNQEGTTIGYFDMEGMREVGNKSYCYDENHDLVFWFERNHNGFRISFSDKEVEGKISTNADKTKIICTLSNSETYELISLWKSGEGHLSFQGKTLLRYSFKEDKQKRGFLRSPLRKGELIFDVIEMENNRKEVLAVLFLFLDDILPVNFDYSNAG